MTTNKGDRFRATYSGGRYEISGRWNGNWVLSPLNSGDEYCLIYSVDEIALLEFTGKLVREAGREV